MKSPFELHNTTQNTNQTRIQRNAEAAVPETRESSKFCAVKTASELNSSGSIFQYDKVSAKLESVSKIEGNFSTQCNN